MATKKRPAASRTRGDVTRGRIEELRRGLAALAKLAPTQPELSTTGEPWTEADLASFESKHRVSLPSSYRLYLTSIGDGGAGFAHHGPCCGGIRSLRSATPDALARLAKVSPLTKPIVGIDHTPAFDGCLWIGTRSDHCAYWLVVTGPRAGEVWVDGSGIESGTIAPENPADFLELNLVWIAGQKRKAKRADNTRTYKEAFAEGHAKELLATLKGKARERASATFLCEGPEKMVLHAQNKDYEAVIALAPRSLELYPDELWVWDSLGFSSVQLAMANPGRARDFIALMDPYMPQLHAWVASPSAERELTIASVLANVSALYNYVQRFADARVLLERGSPDLLKPFPFNNLINALLGEGNADGAQRAIDDAVKRQGDLAAYYVQRAKVYALRGDESRAVDELATAKKRGYPLSERLRTNEHLARLEPLASYRALFVSDV